MISRDSPAVHSGFKPARRRGVRSDGEKHLNKIAVREHLVEHFKCEKRDQDQQQDNTGRQHLIERAAANAGDNFLNRPMMQEAEADLFDKVQGGQKHEEGERFVQNRPKQRQRPEPLSEPQGASEKNEFRKNQRLGRRETEWANAMPCASRIVAFR